jgi:mono/diheme cytochrome c family protein
MEWSGVPSPLCAIVLELALLLAPLARASDSGLYERHCAFCHGPEGRGDGPAAGRLPTPPADFTSANFKLRSTRSGAMPTDDDLLGTITRGVPGTGMPSFAALSADERNRLVASVKELSRPREGGPSYFETRPVPRPIRVPPGPRATPALVARGRKLYRELSCASCHGEEGRGNGSSAAELKDYAGRSLHPTDFTLGILKGGADARQLYLRIATGLNGTPMAEYGDDVVTPTDRWALVEYLRSLVGR